MCGCVCVCVDWFSSGWCPLGTGGAGGVGLCFLSQGLSFLLSWVGRGFHICWGGLWCFVGVLWGWWVRVYSVYQCIGVVLVVGSTVF